jgi:Tfp pilus assembly protein PilF
MADTETALTIRPGMTEALQLHAVLAAGSGKFRQAIEDLQQLQKATPDSPEVLLQLGMFYSADKQPRKALETFDAVLAADAKSWMAYRGRADAYLSIGKQAEAIADYEQALKLQPENSGILNNLAWVLATSPEDKLRNGKRALELAKAACDLTDYKEAHILSTLAAAYAEVGDFAKAVEWSKKAVELGKDQPQLSKELESYRANKPWREAELSADAPNGPGQAKN